MSIFLTDVVIRKQNIPKIQQMADKMKSTNKTIKPKRPSTVSVPTSSRSKIVPKEKSTASCSKKVDHDISILKQEHKLPNFDDEYRQIAYGRFMRAMLEECLVDEKIKREETQVDLQMAQLAERFQKTTDQLDKTNRRLKDISFAVEQKRLLDLKNKDSAQFYTLTENSNANTLLQDLSTSENACLDKIELRNVDFGFNKTSGYKQLLDAVNDAIEGLEKIKKESKLDVSKFAEYDRSKESIKELDNDRFDLETLKSEFEAKLPKMSERLLQEASEKIARMIENDDEDDDRDEDDD